MVGAVIILGVLIGGYVFVHASKRSGVETPTVTSKTVVPAKSLETPSHSPVTVAVPADPVQVPILTYHTVAPATDKPEGKMAKHYHITPEHFDTQMKYLADNGYTPIQFQTYANYLLGKVTLPAKPVVLTFDDGWENQYQFAYPILQKYKFTATFFIITKVRGGGYMSWDNIRDLDSHGFEIASHSETHPKLTILTDAQKLHNEIVGSKSELELELKHPITTLAYPYYQQNESIRKLVEDAGYTAARAGWGSFKNDVNHIFEVTSQEAVNNDNPFSSKL